MESHSTSISVVIVTFNGAPWIRQCLQSLQDEASRCHVIVVDNASTDNTCEIIASHFPSTQMVRSESNLGFGAGNNIGIKEALQRGSKYVLLLNQDAYLLPETLEAMATFMSKHEDIGVVSPLHCSPDSSRLDVRTMRGYLSPYAPDYLADACAGVTKDYYEVRGLNAAAWFVRAEVFRRVGGFDPIFFMYGEDDDLINRLEYHAIRFALLPSCRIVHLRQSPPSAPLGLIRDIYRRSERRRSEIIARVKNPRFGMAHILLVFIADGCIMPVAEVLIRREFRNYVASLIAASRVLFGLPRILRHNQLCISTGPHFL